MGLQKGASSLVALAMGLSCLGQAGAVANFDELPWLPKSEKKAVVTDRVVIGQAWVGHQVGFSLLTVGDEQYVGYYNKDRQMTIAKRGLGEDSFKKNVLPSMINGAPPINTNVTSTIIGWDSHNYVTMAADAQGRLHVSGNMHNNHLTYFRTDVAGELSSLDQKYWMVGANENKVTYPKFMDGPDGKLVFGYRDGTSGSGNQIYNIYDPGQNKWSRLLDDPLTDGQGQMNAYIGGPELGPDGYYHVSWGWRNTSNVATNHDVFYARSADMVNWESASGEVLDLPMYASTQGALVDPVPTYSSKMNGGGRIGYDGDNNVVLTYHKNDEDGNTQLYAARYEGDEWDVIQLTDWDYHWDLSGSGTISYDISVEAASVFDDGLLQIPYRHKAYGSGLLIVDSETFEAVGKQKKPITIPTDLWPVESEYPGMRRHFLGDSGDSGNEDVRYVLRWETMGKNNDQPRDDYPVDGSELVLYEISVPEPTMIGLMMAGGLLILQRRKRHLK
ncbi:BNR-4 repeat-containing protein [Planctomycetota bacterium]|nr:BNR-4 repeat-containing protein [Planctomycetota bacterium]